MSKHRHDKYYIDRLLMSYKFEAASIALEWEKARAEPSDEEADGEENMELKGSMTATEQDLMTEEAKMPELPQPDQATPIKREKVTDAKLGKRAEPEPEEDPETGDWI